MAVGMWGRNVGPRLVTLVISAVLGTLVMAAVAALTPPRYVASAWVGVAITDNVAEGHLPPLTGHVLRTMPTLAQAMQSAGVLRAAAQQAQVEPDQLADSVAVVVPVNTQVLKISVRWHDPDTAAKLANLVAAQADRTIPDLLARTEIAQPSFVVKQLGPALVPEAPATPSWPKNLAAGALGGGAIGLWLTGRRRTVSKATAEPDTSAS